MKKILFGFSLILLLIIIGLFNYQPTRSIIFGITPFLSSSPELPQEGESLPFILPQGFSARLYSKKLPGVRVLTRDPRGVLTASLPEKGKIVALPDEDGNGVSDETVTILGNLNNPHGIIFRCNDAVPIDGNPKDCTLFVAEENAVTAYTYTPLSFNAEFKEKLADLPGSGGHSTRSLFLHPDGKRLLVSVGSSCNVCEEKDSRRASILAIDLETKKVALYATGLRNTVFMTLHPVTGALWGTDMGRDLLGDDLPPDEINIIEEGGWYGWPWFYGKNIEDMNFSPKTRPSFAKEPVKSYIDIPAHSAPLGLSFVPEEGWPEEYWYDLLVAYHGSWNRSVPTGYKITRLNLDSQGNFKGVSDFMTGFTGEGKVLGRPVAILVEPGGTIYVSDDRAGAIYKITQEKLPR